MSGTGLEGLPIDAWRAFAALLSFVDLVPFRACGQHVGFAVALDEAVSRLRSVDLSFVAPLDAKTLRQLLAGCPRAEAVWGVHCGAFFAKPVSVVDRVEVDEIGSLEHSAVLVMPPLPIVCRRLGLRLDDTWDASDCSSFLRAVSAWIQKPLDHLTLAWNPSFPAVQQVRSADEDGADGDGRMDSTDPEYAQLVNVAAGAISTAWCLKKLRSFTVSRVPPELGRAILQRAILDGACLEAMHVSDVPLPPASAAIWHSLSELSYSVKGEMLAIDDNLLALLARSAPPLRALRLTDRRLDGGEQAIVSVSGLRALCPILGKLEELRLSRKFGPFCKASDLDILMQLCGCFGVCLKQLDLEGFPRLSDAALLEMLSRTRTHRSSALVGGVNSLRIQVTSVTDGAFVNGLDEALAPSLHELRLHCGNSTMGDGALHCLAETGRCRDLERLALGGCNFTDSGLLSIFPEARNLRFLYLRETTASEEALVALADSARSLQELAISDCCSFGDNGLYALRNLPLTLLRLGSCPRITSKGVADLLDHIGPRLSGLSLEHCKQLSNSCFLALPRGARWLRLQHLRLIKLKISGRVLDWCRDTRCLPNLRRLDVWRARWQESIAEEMAEFRVKRPNVVLTSEKGATLGWDNW